MGIGILLVDKENDQQIGLVGFDSSGVLGYSLIIEGFHFYAMKPVDHFFEISGFEPLYEKYSDQMQPDNTLPNDILKKEAAYWAEAINKKDPPLQVARHLIKAIVVEYEDEDEDEDE